MLYSPSQLYEGSARGGDRDRTPELRLVWCPPGLGANRQAWLNSYFLQSRGKRWRKPEGVCVCKTKLAILSTVPSWLHPGARFLFQEDSQQRWEGTSWFPPMVLHPNPSWLKKVRIGGGEREQMHLGGKPITSYSRASVRLGWCWNLLLITPFWFLFLLYNHHR